MSKNLINEITKMLGVEIGEEFKIRGDDRTCFIDLDGLHLDYHVADDEDNAMLRDLLCGEVEIIKIPWKPKEGEIFYSFGTIYGKWVVCSDMWAGAPCDYALLDKGWVYHSKQEAEAALPKAAAKFGGKI